MEDQSGKTGDIRKKKKPVEYKSFDEVFDSPDWERIAEGIGFRCFLQNLTPVISSFPAKGRGVVEEWAELHQDELMEIWETKEFHPIKPLV